MTTSNDDAHIVTPDSTTSTKRGRRRLLSRVSIQSKLLVMLLMTSVLSAAVVGAIGYQSVTSTAYAVDEVTVLQVGREHMEQLVLRKPLLLQEIGRTIEERHDEVRRALAAGPE